LQDIDFKKIGLKAGIEIHQQLDSKNKLFCDCSNSISEEKEEFSFLRKLRATQSEMGEVDRAALFEFEKGRTILYEGDHTTSCLVEMDEEPPHNLNQEAVDIALIISLILGAKPVDEIHVMRKIVIDGSNTTGFQRTCVISLDGSVVINGLEVPIQHVGLEEDAARKIEESDTLAKYRIDRLGMPLVEIATGPIIRNPKETEEVAYAIGRILRATKKVKRGLGSIRQDVNVSIKDGAIIEIKGVQKLYLLSKIVEFEAQRQLKLLEIKDELKVRKADEQDITDSFVDVSHVFEKTTCKVLKNTLIKKRHILAVLLKKFSGLLGLELGPNLRFGTELAHRAIFWGKVGGLFHTDELPKYGITQEEVNSLKKEMKASEEDTVVFVADEYEKATDGLKAVVERAKEAFHGVPEETRGPNPDGTTRYMRPRPGSARMYPETDVPPTVLIKERISMIKKNLPPHPEKIIEEIMEKYKINEKLAEQLLDSDYLYLFEDIATKTDLSPSFVATVLTENIKSLERDGVPVDNLSENQIIEIFNEVNKGSTAKESVVEILEWLSKNRSTVSQAINSLGLGMIDLDNLKRIISKNVEKQSELGLKDPKIVFKKLMGSIMGEVRGKADAKTVSKLLKEEIDSCNS
jgi:glutamyl-tRNA(Gln) amidotransferase subunit E